MEFSIFLSHMSIDPPSSQDNMLFENKLTEAKVADACGFECIWVPEHHLIHFMQAPSGLLLCVHYGNHVSCPIGQMVNLLVYRHPLIVAGEIALADRLLGGRLQLGVGRGAYEYEFRRLEIPWEKANDKFLECLDVIEKIWSREDGGIDYAGDSFRFESTYVWPRPVQKPCPTIWFAAMTPPSIEFAAAKGYHVANWPFLRPMSFVEDIAEKFHICREELEIPRGGQKLAVMRPVYVAETEAKARECLETMLTNHRISQKIRAPGVQSDSRGYVSPEALEQEPSLDEAFERMIAGTPEQCLEKLQRYADLGVDHFITWFDFGMGHQQTVDSMQMFAETVMEPFRREAGLIRASA